MRKNADETRSWKKAAHASSVEATTAPAYAPRTSSSAWLGPLSNAMRSGCPKISPATSGSRRPESASRPLDSSSTGASGASSSATACARPATAKEGTATTSARAPRTHAGKSALACTFSSSTSGKRRGFFPEAFIASASCGLWHHRAIGSPLPPSKKHKAVPNAPAPATAMGCCSMDAGCACARRRYASSFTSLRYSSFSES